MPKLPWTPWHDVVQVRPDLKSGELSLATFAADLYEVTVGRARSVYRDPQEFFALTYPTINLRGLAKDVVDRLAGKSDKAIRQLELTYGGGKTHALITLYHLVNDPVHLPDLPAVHEFINHITYTPPQARICALTFDKLDLVTGMEVRAPDGEMRWLKHPWSILAFQLAGCEGLRILNPDAPDTERDIPPAENLLSTLLAYPARDGLSTLILIDEVLMYARQRVEGSTDWLSRLTYFFQGLTQAAVKIDRCAIVASLLASDPRRNDALGRQVASELSKIFQREQESLVQPVQKEDVAEVLRRRFFTPESIRDREAFRPHVIAAIQGILDLDEQSRKVQKVVEDAFLDSYPFHPNLTDVFYTKWTNLEGFQRTRGVLRTFALALRAAESWDESPLIAANVFLTAPGQEGIAEAARELTTIAATEEYEGKRQEWAGILESELEKARDIQAEMTGLRFREVEQAVFATFLHSQPIGQKVQTRDLLVLLGHTRPDKIDLEKALLRWTDVSWFLDEASISEGDLVPDGVRHLPKSWRLGSKPNLKQMHHDACTTRVSTELVEAKLIERASKLKSLTEGASAAEARVHNLVATNATPSDIEDDGDFHYAVLGPKAASESGKPSPEARRFIEVKSITDQPRVYRNVVVLAVPSRDGLDAARNAIRNYLGWEEVESQLKGQDVDAVRRETLRLEKDKAASQIPELLQQAYCIVVTVSKQNEVQAFKVNVGKEPLFNTIKADKDARILDAAISPDTLLPGGPYDLWREGEAARWVKDLVSAFASSPRLPKMLNRKAIEDTIVAGCRSGAFVLRAMRPDRTYRTFWREEPDSVALKDPGLEAVLPDAATLTSLVPGLLAPDVLPGLWTGTEITLGRLREYFAGSYLAFITQDGYEEPVAIPGVESGALNAAVGDAVRDGTLWLTLGQASLYKEDVQPELLANEAVLQAPPEPLSSMSVIREKLPEAWPNDTTTAKAIADALSEKAGKPLPWSIVHAAITAALSAGWIELDGGIALPTDALQAYSVILRVPAPKGDEHKQPSLTLHQPAGPGYRMKQGTLVAQAELQPIELQELGDQASAILKEADGLALTFRLTIELNGTSSIPEDVVGRINEVLQAVSPHLQLARLP